MSHPKSRAEVSAEVKAARKDGTLYQRDGDSFPEQTAKSVKTRAEVRAEMTLARERGELASSEAWSFDQHRIAMSTGTTRSVAGSTTAGAH